MQNETPESRRAPERKTVMAVSALEGLNGEHAELPIELAEDGRTKALALFDIDGTLAECRFIYDKAVERLFPDRDPRDVAETFRAGWTLGNEFREFDRMHGVFREGHEEWRNVEVYIATRLEKYRDEIDKPGFLAHARAAEYLGKFAGYAKSIADETYMREPEKFEQVKIGPIFKLAELYKRLGVPMVLVTANEENVAHALVKYLKLSDLFLDMATEETMEGGGKELAIPYLIKKLEEKGVPVPADRLVFIGDSLRGDIGSVVRLGKGGGGAETHGILVLKDQHALEEMRKQIQGSPELQAIVSSIDTEALVVENVPLGKDGRPLLGGRHRARFLTKLNVHTQ